nr:PAAR domain-containing protein [Providencia stuartii]
MRCTIDNRKVIQKGDTTSTGGTVLERSDVASQKDIDIATEGMKVFCPACKKTGTIKAVIMPPRVKTIHVVLQIALIWNWRKPISRTNLVVLRGRVRVGIWLKN